jgi:hypothetical protein
MGTVLTKVVSESNDLFDTLGYEELVEEGGEVAQGEGLEFGGLVGIAVAEEFGDDDAVALRCEFGDKVLVI